MHTIQISSSTLHTRIKELATEIAEKYHTKPLMLLGVLKGAVPFQSDLAKELFIQGINPTIEYIRITSYGNSKESSRNPIIEYETAKTYESVHILVVEDIVDTGHSMQKLLSYLKEKNPKSISVCTLLSKPSRREVPVPLDFVGFEIDEIWVEGYGMDTEELYRGSPDILVRK